MLCSHGEVPADAGSIQQAGDDNCLVCSTASRRLCAQSCLRACRVCTQAATAFCSWSLTDSLLEMVTLRIYSYNTRAVSGSVGGGVTALRVRLLLVNVISAHLMQFKWRLLMQAHTSILFISTTLLWVMLCFA